MQTSFILAFTYNSLSTFSKCPFYLSFSSKYSLLVILSSNSRHNRSLNFLISSNSLIPIFYRIKLSMIPVSAFPCNSPLTSFNPILWSTYSFTLSYIYLISNYVYSLPVINDFFNSRNSIFCALDDQISSISKRILSYSYANASKCSLNSFFIFKEYSLINSAVSSISVFLCTLIFSN